VVNLLNMCIKNPLFNRGKVGTFTLENRYGLPIQECSESFLYILRLNSIKDYRFLDLIDQKDRDKFLKDQIKFRKKRLEHWEFPLIKLKTGDNNYIYSEIHIVPIYENSKISQFLGYIIDITEEIEEKNLFKTLSRLAPIGLCMYKGDHVIFCNNIISKITGYQKKEIKNMQDIFSLVYPEDRQIFSSDKKHIEAQIRLFTRDKKLKWLHVILNKTKYKKDEYTIAIIEDITDLIKLDTLKDFLFKVNKVIISSGNEEKIFSNLCTLFRNIHIIRRGNIHLVKKDSFKYICDSGKKEEKISEFIKEVVNHIRGEKIFYIPDLRKFPLDKKLKEFFQKENINSAVVLPVKFKKELYLISLFLEGVDYLENRSELDLIIEIRDDIKFALKHIHQQKKLFLQKYFDELTGVGNRNFFVQYLKSLKEQGVSFTVYLIDLYHFKYINEEYGRDFGDKILRYIAKKLDSKLIDENIFRVGFDEFAVVSKEGKVIKTIEDIKNVLSNIRIGGNRLRLDFNMAVIKFPEDEKNIDKLLIKLERLLEFSKNQGKNVIEYFSEKEYSKVKHFILIENKLEEALKNDAFDIYLQPIVRVSSNKIVGAEALIRWEDNEGNFIPPSRFIPVAEETGLIKEIDICMLLKTKKVIEHLRNVLNKKINLSVNITPAYINNILNFFEKMYIPRCKVETDLDFSSVTNQITLELTERETVEIYESKEKLKKLKELGFKISIDDFGTGYSSLSYLINLDVDYLKIDMQFVQQITENEKVYKLVKSIINMAKIFGIKTVAEGVETEQQLKELKKLGCNFYQGFLFSPPVPVEEFINIVKQS